MLGGAAAYVALPYALVQLANLGLIREGKRAKREVALTFDDGPDPQTTPAVLDALREVGGQATFFVMAGKAQAHPELVGRMLAEGHEVAIHAEKHRHGWVRSPWGAFLDPIRASQSVQAVTGQTIKYHRPPHGAYTLVTILGQRAAGLTGVHWSIEGQDWNAKLTPQQVKERLLRLTVPGAVIVLHDAGPGARNTVPMLPDLLRELHERGYRFKTVSKLEGAGRVGRADLVRRAFIALDAVFDRLGKIQTAGGRADNLFRTGYAKFPLSGVALNDGTPVPRGKPATEFHVNNPVMVDMGLLRSVRQAREDFRAVARDMQTRPDLQGTEVIFCLSSLHAMISKLGFETHDLSPADTKRLQRWASVLRRAYGSDPNAPQPKLSIMSRAAFLARYSEQKDQP